MECDRVSGDDWARAWFTKVWVRYTATKTANSASSDKRSFISVLLKRELRPTCRSILRDRTEVIGWPASHLEDPENRGWFLALQDLHGYVVDRNACSGLAIGRAVMSVAVKNHVSAVTIDHLGQARTAQIRIDLGGLSSDRVPNRRIVKNHDSLASSQLRHGAFQLQSLVNGGLHERLDFGFAESGQRAASKTPGKALGAGKSDAIAFVCRTIKKLDSGVRHHSHEFGLATAFVVVVSQDRYDR